MSSRAVPSVFPRTRSRPAVIVFLMAAVGFLTAFVASAAVACREDIVDDERAAQVKAGMTINFIRYTEWPEESFASSASPIVVVILGDGPIRPHLEETMRAQQVHERPVEVRRVAFPVAPTGATEAPESDRNEYLKQLRAAHVLFVCESERDRVRTVLAQLDGADTLTVSDMKEFAERGGMLALAVRRGKVAFDANAGEIDATRLKVSSYLLRLAGTVKTQDP